MKAKNKKKTNTEKVTKIARQQEYMKMEKIPIPAIRAFHRPPYSGTNITQKGK